MRIYKRGILFLIVSSLFMCISIYFSSIYNPNVISFELKNNIKTDFLDDLSNSELPVYELRYEKEYGEGTLIMTSGKVQYFADEKLYRGLHVSKDIKDGIVLGDEIVGLKFRHLDVLGEEYELLGNVYTVVGILEDSHDIMIPYNEKLLTQNWVKRLVSFHVKTQENIPAKQSYLRTQIVLNGGQIRTGVVNYEYALVFKNISIFIIFIWLIQYMIHWIKKIIDESKVFKQYFTEEKVRKLYRMIAKEKSRELLQIFVKIIIMMVVFTATIICLSKINIPKRLIANSIMSVESWYNLFKYYFDQVTISFRYGFISIRRDFIVWSLVSMLVSIRLFHTYRIDKQVSDEI
ncbi:MAG: hypothetical protein JEZ08_15180 [Clostridiales bacterium]|nr:hypothetical protein [Clostridiales bacterium]